jgi:Tol biopolymer transport system component
VTASTAGDTLDPDGYTVTLDGEASREVEPDGTVTFEEVEEGEHEMEISGVQVNCAADGGAARTVSVTAGQTLTTLVGVTCRAALFDRIIFHSDRDGNLEIYAMEPDGASQTRLTAHDAADLQPRVSPDGTRVAFYSNREGSTPDAFDIYVMDADGSDVTRVTAGSACCPEWSPDGETLLFQSFRDGGDADLYLVDPDGSDLRRVTDDPADERYGTWSADGATILFSSLRDGDDEIYRMNPDGSGLERLTDNSVPDVRARESADGERIAFARFTGTGHDVFRMDADGGAVVQLTSEADVRDTHPAWSPDGAHIVFASNRDGNDEIYSMEPDGGGLENLTSDGARDGTPTWTPARE